MFFSELEEDLIMSLITNPYFIIASGVLALITQFLFDLVNISSNVPMLETDDSDMAMSRNLNILQSHPECGMTFDRGREECWWNCASRKSDGTYASYFSVCNDQTQLELFQYC